MAKEKSQTQVAFLLSKGSPLSAAQEDKLKRELHKGTVRIKKKGRKGRKSKRGGSR